MTRLLDRVKCVLASADIIVYRHGSPGRTERIRSVNAVKSERQLLLTHVEAEQLINAVQATTDVPGDLAEVGVFRGASARLIRQYGSTTKKLHLCDTFEGLPTPDPRHDAEFREGEFAVGMKEVQGYLGHEGLHYHIGRFPESANEIMQETKFSFVHLDVDLYEGTLECLRFFYRRMSPGGIILSHDFGAERAPGVKKAFEEYFHPLGVPFMQLSGYQGMVTKVVDTP